MNCVAFSVGLLNDTLFAFDFILAMLEYSSACPIFSTAAFASGIFIAWGIGMGLCTKFSRLIELNPLSAM